MFNNLIAAVQQSVSLVSPEIPILVGFSGGVDSTVLLHSLVTHVPQRQYIAVHVNHGLSTYAQQWQSHCQQEAERLGIPFVAERVQIDRSAGNIEQQARQARYASFAKHLRPSGAIVLGHHRDDQQETVLLRLLRGSGPKGLSGMARNRSFNSGQLLRPLLAIGQSEIKDYARAYGLEWIDDDSNTDDRFDRNFLRNVVVPKLNERWPASAQTLSRAAELMRDYDQLADILAQQDLNSSGLRRERCGFSVDDQHWHQWPGIRRNNVLRAVLRRVGFPELSQAILEQIEIQLFPAEVEPDSQATVSWADVCIRRFNQRLYFIDNRAVTPVQSDANNAHKQRSWLGQEPMVLADGSYLSLARGGSFAWDGQPLTIAFRRGGERCHPHTRQHSQTLKKLLQESKLEPWLRDRIPLIKQGGEIVAVGDLWVEHGYSTDDQNLGYGFHWQLPQLLP